MTPDRPAARVRRGSVRTPPELAGAEPLTPTPPQAWRKLLAGGLAVALVAVTVLPRRRGGRT